MKKIVLFFIMFIFAFFVKGFAQENSVLRNYTELELPAGTFIPVINTVEISTLYSNIGSKYKFISTSDMYLRETNIIPKNSEFYGYIEKLNEPVIGTNASMVIKIVKVVLPDGFEMPTRAYIYSPNHNLLGGELTPPETYDTKPSYRQGCNTVLGHVPGASRQMGQHKVISAGSALLIVLTGPLYITHTVTN